MCEKYIFPGWKCPVARFNECADTEIGSESYSEKCDNCGPFKMTPKAGDVT